MGRLLPDTGDSVGWSAKDKFAAVLEMATLSEAEVVEYCRLGLYLEQIHTWREACEQANNCI